MKIICTLLLIFSTNLLCAQDTLYFNKKDIKVTKDSIFSYYIISKYNKELNRYSKEEYNQAGFLASRIIYKDSLLKVMDGEFIIFFKNSTKIKSIKNYTKNNLNGELITYWSNGALRRKDLFENGKFKKGVCYDSNAVVIPHFDYEIMPKYPGGEKKLIREISKNVEYPVLARKNNIEGKVYLSFIVNKEGLVEDLKVTRGVHPLLDEAAITTLTNTFKNKRFTPGYEETEAVKVQFNLPINYSLR